MSSGRIGIFDSGVGGLTVAARLMQRCPHLGLHYFGDTAHVPYGNRSAEEVTTLVENVVRHLIESGVSAVVMACNTSNALAYESMKQWCPVPLVPIIEPAARAAASLTRNGRIGLIATPLTARSGYYERAVQPSVVPLNGPAQPAPSLYAVGCSRLVPLIEAGEVHTPEAREHLAEYLAPLQEREVDTLIMGCTHYPFLQPMITEMMGPRVNLVDPADYVVEELAKLRLTTPEGHRFEVSGHPADFERVGSRLLGRRISACQSIDLRRYEPLAV